MGIEFLAIQFELEKRLQITRRRGDFAAFDLTAGGLDEIVWQILQEKSRTEQSPGTIPISPDDCWREVREALAEVLVLDPEKIGRESHLIYDLGMD